MDQTLGKALLIMGLNISVCAYDSVSSVSGPATWVQRIPPALIQAGHSVKLHLFWWEQEGAGTLRRFAEREGLPFSSHQFTKTQQNVRALLKTLEGSPPHVLIADNVIPAFIAAPYLKQAGTRTIGIIRSDDSFYHGIIDRFAAGRDQDRIHAFVAVSEYLGDEVRRRSRGQCLSRVIPSGAPIPSQHAKYNPEIFQVVYSGRLVEEQKRILDTTRCMIRLCKKNANIRGVIIGDGIQREMVEDLVRSAEVPISVVGRKSPDEVQQILLQSHAILLLSDYEGTPTAVMEAMACGVVPVCLAMRSGIPELVIHEKTGLIVTDRGESCIHALQSLAQTADRWQLLSCGARQHAAASFSTEASAARWNSFVLKLSDGRPTDVCRVPAQLRLPPTHPAYGHQDRRDPDAFQRMAALTGLILKRSRFHVGRLKRKILGDSPASTAVFRSARPRHLPRPQNPPESPPTDSTRE